MILATCQCIISSYTFNLSFAKLLSPSDTTISSNNITQGGKLWALLGPQRPPCTIEVKKLFSTKPLIFSQLEISTFNRDTLATVVKLFYAFVWQEKVFFLSQVTSGQNLQPLRHLQLRTQKHWSIVPLALLFVFVSKFN